MGMPFKMLRGMDLRAVLLLCWLPALCLGAVSVSREPAFGDNPRCTLPWGETLAVGDSTNNPHGCSRFSCNLWRPHVYLEEASCGLATIDLGSPCRLSSDPRKPYPLCCPTPECPPPSSGENLQQL